MIFVEDSEDDFEFGVGVAPPFFVVEFGNMLCLVMELVAVADTHIVFVVGIVGSVAEDTVYFVAEDIGIEVGPGFEGIEFVVGIEGTVGLVAEGRDIVVGSGFGTALVGLGDVVSFVVEDIGWFAVEDTDIVVDSHFGTESAVGIVHSVLEIRRLVDIFEIDVVGKKSAEVV